MGKFIEIERINSYGEPMKALVRVNDIVQIKQLHVGTSKTYDEDGNVVTETPRDEDYLVFFQNEFGKPMTEYHIAKDEYARLSEILLKL